MFLKELKPDQQYAFLELADIVAKADGIVTSEEEKLIQTYESEMQITTGSYQVQGISLENILGKFDDAKSRKIAYVEILALAMADSKVCENEKSLITEIEKSFSIKTEERERFLNWLERINQLYSEGFELVYGG